MRVDIDPAGRDQHAFRVDLALRASVDLTDCGDAVAGDGDIAVAARCAVAGYQRRIADDQVVHRAPGVAVGGMAGHLPGHSHINVDVSDSRRCGPAGGCVKAGARRAQIALPVIAHQAVYTYSYLRGSLPMSLPPDQPLPSHPRPLKGRGAVLNPANRFDPLRRQAEDDGWWREADPESVVTVLSPEQGQSSS